DQSIALLIAFADSAALGDRLDPRAGNDIAIRFAGLERIPVADPEIELPVFGNTAGRSAGRARGSWGGRHDRRGKCRDGCRQSRAKACAWKFLLHGLS